MLRRRQAGGPAVLHGGLGVLRGGPVVLRGGLGVRRGGVLHGGLGVHQSFMEV